MYTNTPKDPRNPLPNRSEPLSPWAVDLFNIGPRNRLRLQLHFQYNQRVNDPENTNPHPIYNAIHTVSIIRRFLLIGAQGMGNHYRGIRVIVWAYNPNLRGEIPVEILVECDDEHYERNGSIVSRLQNRTFGARGAPIPPTRIFDASERPLPYIEPMPPPPPPPESLPPERAYGDDEEDEENPSILGP